MDNIKMNTQLGTKWFTFFTKVRPWFACLTAIPTIVDFIEHIDLYLSIWWMLLAFIGTIVACILAIVVFIKSKEDYVEFVHFIKGVLFFEVINMAYQKGVQQYIDNEFDIDFALIAFVIIFVFGYFLWYRLNVNYFKKRINAIEITTQTEDLPCNIAITCYCTNCGKKLIDDNNFCGKCGAPVIRK